MTDPLTQRQKEWRQVLDPPGFSPRPEWDNNYRKPRKRWTDNQKIAAVVAVIGALIIAAVLIVHAVGHHSAGQTLSWRDGYASAGDTLVGGTLIPCSYGAVGAVTWDIPAGDNVNQWIAGCVAGQNAANFDAQHPGANGGNS